MRQDNIPKMPEILPHGMDGIVVRFTTQSAVDATGAVQLFREQVSRLPLDGLTEVAGSLCSVRIGFDPTIVSRTGLIEQLEPLLAQTNWQTTPAPEPTRRWTIPVAFGETFGPQLSEAAALAGQSVEGAIADITGADLRVLAIGFAPGQPYIGLMPEHWGFSRQSELNPEVPAGALVAAVRQFVLFTNPSTTGWRHIGQTGFRPFLQHRRESFLLKGGDAIRFVAVADNEMRGLNADPDGIGGAKCEVLS